MDEIKDLKDLRALFPEMKDYTPSPDEQEEEVASSLEPDGKQKSSMKLYVSRDKKMRAGKQVTLIEGFDGTDEQANHMLSNLKSLCSAGGALKEGQLIIQGDHVKKVITWLTSKGYKSVKQKGG